MLRVQYKQNLTSKRHTFEWPFIDHVGLRVNDNVIRFCHQLVDFVIRFCHKLVPMMSVPCPDHVVVVDASLNYTITDQL